MAASIPQATYLASLGRAARASGVRTLDPALAYDRHTGRYAPVLAAAFVSVAGVRPGMRARDLGCGPGAMAAELAQLLGATRVGAAEPAEKYVDAWEARLRHRGRRASSPSGSRIR